jgi:putative flippase GtrA
VKSALLEQIARFAVVGTIGFAMDGGILYLLVSKGVDPYVARAISFPPAVTVTWFLNRIWTFAANDGAARRQYARYFAVQIAGALSNYLVYGLILSFVDRTAVRALLALAAGSAAGLIVNFIGARSFAFVSIGDARIRTR